MDEGRIRKKDGFTMVMNEIARDSRLSLRAKGVYLLVQSYITMPDREWQKKDFVKMVHESRNVFDGAWDELKRCGYIKKHQYALGRGFRVEFELLDKAEDGPHTFYHNAEGKITRVESYEEKNECLKNEHS